MPELLILEFDGVTADDYKAVNDVLDIDPDGDGPWPSPLLDHVGATNDDGLVVVEVWESKEAQAEFMARLGPALAKVGVPDPKRMEWLSIVGHHVQ